MHITNVFFFRELTYVQQQQQQNQLAQHRTC